MTSESENTLMGPAEVAKYLGVSERTLYQWAQSGKVPAFKVGSVWRFRRNEIDRWLESNRSGPSVDEVEPLTPYSEPPRSKWRIRKQEEEADVAIREACRAYIESTIQTVGQDIFTIEDFEDRFGSDVVRTVINQLKKDKIIKEDEHEGWGGEKVTVIMRRN